MAQGVVGVDELFVPGEKHLELGHVLVLGHPGAAVGHEVTALVIGPLEGGGHEVLGHHVPVAGRFDAGFLPDAHFLLVGAGVVTPGEEPGLGRGDLAVGVSGALRLGDASRIGRRADQEKFVGTDQAGTAGPALGHGLFLGRRGMDHDHVDLTGLEHVQGLARAGLDPVKATAGLGAVGLAEHFEQSQFTGTARGQGKGFRSRAVGFRDFGPGLGRPGQQGKTQHWQQEVQDQTHANLLFGDNCPVF